ncbi:MAG: hypothetical protein OET41_01440 [Xanthomonadales bacterium]|jgi:hypothetical protein|nr:hypothetical protein [Xanthomonadales bacterium]MDH3940913.1 hypothetical protein [Xanthomonadales bacterium]MDH4000840.1 hypothetical protein [Xanthomonadales bacterium]
MSRLATFILVASFLLAFSDTLEAQGPPPSQGPVSFNFDGGFLLQSNADLDEGDGGFSVNRWFLGLGVTYAWDRRNSIGLSVGGGSASYDFDDTPAFGPDGPWEKIEDSRISVVGRIGFGETGQLFIIPSFRYNGEDDAKTSDGRTWGILAAAFWRINPDLNLGPGIGVFSRLEDGTRVFPILAIDWNITEKWNLGTGRGLAASQGPGLTLSYKFNNRWSMGLAGRYERIEFRLNEEGATPGGVGEDRSFPLVLTANWQPNPIVGLNLFAGIELGGKLKLKNEFDELLAESDYDPAAIFGGTFELRF